MKITAIIATSSTVPCRYSVGRSMATAPNTAARPEPRTDRLTTMTATKAATNPPRANVTWAW